MKLRQKEEALHRMMMIKNTQKVPERIEEECQMISYLLMQASTLLVIQDQIQKTLVLRTSILT